VLYAETTDEDTPARLESVVAGAGCALTARPAWHFRPDDARDVLLDHYGVRTLTGFGLDDGDPAVPAAGALLRYLHETQVPDDDAPSGRLGHLQPPRRQPGDAFVSVDETTLRSLEIERTMRTGQTAGSLLSILQRCATPMGKRLLRHWLCFPLRRLEAIETRQRAVAALRQDAPLAAPLAEHVADVQDVARIAARVAMSRATPRDLVALGRSVAHIDPLVDLLERSPAFAETRDRLRGLAGALAPLARTIAERCVESPPAHLRDGGVIREGVDAELDEARGLQQDASTWLAEYQRQLGEETGISSLKVGFNKVFGYYIEVTHTHAAKVPDTFTRKQTLKNAERYITPQLKEYEDKVLTAKGRAIEREQELFAGLCAEAGTHTAALAAYAECVAELDVLSCFAAVADAFGYVRPTLVEEPVLDVRQGRHPVLDRTLGDGFVPNDCALGVTGADDDAGDASTLALITGPNMAGKSTFIRQVAIITLLAHTGCCVPAEAATIGLVDRIFTRIGASDELHAGQSTFMVEMTETANILNHATDRSLVILDEIGRGTSTLDGLALAWAIAESIATRRCRTLFATHYHELTTLADQWENVCNRHVSVREWGDEIVFLYRILPGRTGRSYGIHVARIAGLPPETVERATAVLESLTVHTETPATPPPPAPARATDAQLGLFTEYVEHPVVELIRDLDLNTLTPMDAFEELRELRRVTQAEDR
jgi:DNA mismatch repair protein MutS